MAFGRHRLLAGIALTAALLATSPSTAAPIPTVKFLRAATALINPGILFDPGYHRIPYPRGDVAANTGVCADVVVRAYRGIGIDLQELVHKDMARHFSAYPHVWGLKHPDSNVDHRRVLNLAAFFRRHGTVLKVTPDARDYRAGDLVVWNLDPRGSTPHIGIVMAGRSADGRRPLILHNMGSGQIIQDKLFAYKITGHYRYAIA